MSELVYVYVEQIYSKIRKQSINFSNELTVSFEENKLEIKENDYMLPKNFFGEKISNISLIIGKNGVGKSSLLDLISFGEKNRKKFLPRVQFFQIFHVKNQLFYFEGSDALKRKIFGNNSPQKNTFFFEKTPDGEFFVLKELKKHILEINYQKLRHKIDWIDVNNPTNENDGKISRQLKNSIVINDILEFLPDQKEVFNNEDIIIRIKQKGLYTRYSADILFCLYYGENQDLKDIQESFSIISKRINERLRGDNGQETFTRKYQDDKYKKYKKDYFILRILEKQIIKEIESSENRKEILLEFFETREREKIFLDELEELDEESIDFTWEKEVIHKNINRKINCLVRFLDGVQIDKKSNSRKRIDYSELLSILNSVDEEIFTTFNEISFSVTEGNLLRNKIVTQLSEKYLTMFQMKFSNLSDGEMVYVNTFVQIKKAVTNNNEVLLVLDEPDLNLHPEWSRLFVQSMVSLVERNSSGKVQIIMTTHSPFLLTDFPKKNVFFISESTKNNNKIIKNAKKSFAGNLYDIASDSFFLSFPIGEFARKKLNSFDRITNKEKKNLLELVDDDMLKNILMDSYELNKDIKKDNEYD